MLGAWLRQNPCRASSRQSVFAASFSLYLTGFYHFSSGIKAKKSTPLKIKPPAILPDDRLPTIYELASLAAQLRRNTPQTQSDPLSNIPESVQAAAQLWDWARGQVSSLHVAEGGRKLMEEKKKRSLENVKPPKKFPVSLEKMIQGLIPRRSRTDREKICRAFGRVIHHKVIGGVVTENSLKAFEHRFEEWIQKPAWEHLVFIFKTWFPTYQKDVASEKARKAAKSAIQKKNEKRQLTEISETDSPKPE
jgi:hypothetical protein